MPLLHTSIRTSNLQQTVAFYTVVLGMRLVREKAIPEREMEIAFLESEGNHQIEVIRFGGQAGFQVPAYENRVFDHLAFEIDDMEAVLTRCEEVGGAVVERPFHLPGSSSSYAFIQDPDGVTIELIQRG